MPQRTDATRAVLLALGLAAGWVAVTLAVFFGARALAPQAEPRLAALAAIAVLAALLALWLTATGGWRRAGFVWPGRWPAKGALAVAALIVLLPLARGISLPAGGTLLVLLVGYALTGFAEEGFFRGVMLETARPLGPFGAAALTSLLFGLVHLSNLVIRGNPPVIAAQAVGAACFGFGHAALRLRTGTLWPLVVLHMLTDLFLQIGRLPLIPVAVAQDVILLILGMVLLFRAAGGNPGR